MRSRPTLPRALLRALLRAAHPFAAGAPVTVTFLDVGQGDATLIRSGDVAVFVDGDRHATT